MYLQSRGRDLALSRQIVDILWIIRVKKKEKKNTNHYRSNESSPLKLAFIYLQIHNNGHYLESVITAIDYEKQVRVKKKTYQIIDTQTPVCENTERNNAQCWFLN